MNAYSYYPAVVPVPVLVPMAMPIPVPGRSSVVVRMGVDWLVGF